MPTLKEQGWAPVPCVDLETGERVEAMRVVGPFHIIPPPEKGVECEPGAIRFHDGAKGWVVRGANGCWFGVLTSTRNSQHATVVKADRIQTVAEMDRMEAAKTLPRADKGGV